MKINKINNSAPNCIEQNIVNQNKKQKCNETLIAIILGKYKTPLVKK